MPFPVGKVSRDSCDMLLVLRASTDSRVTSLGHLSKVGKESWEIAPQTFGNQCHRCFGRSRKRFVVLVHLSLRNLVSGYECGRVFPAGVGPGSPSRDAANWLPSRFNLSVETRRRYGWLSMVIPGARLFRAPVWCPSGLREVWRHARGRERCRREPGGTLSGGYAPDSEAEGSPIVDEPGEG